MIRQSLRISLLLVATTINNSVAEVLDDAVEAMRTGDFAEAYCVMRPLAEQGDAYAQYNIGWMYHNGYGLSVNNNRALDWWLLASKQGYSDASFSIGLLYSLGEGNVARDVDLAVDYYLLAAKKGQEDAVTELHSMMTRNDAAITHRINEIVNNYGFLFGKKRVVKGKKINARVGPSTKQKIVAELEKGQVVLELDTKKKWSQVAVTGDSGLGRSVWVYSPLLGDEK